MRKALILLLAVSPMSLFAGGGSGGTPPSIQESTESMRISIDQLPKVYADEDVLRRAAARLGETGTETTDLKIDGETIQVRKLAGSIVDDKVSEEILPAQ